MSRNLLIVDDDAIWLQRVARAMEGLGYVVHCADSLAQARACGRDIKPDYAVIDMRLGDGNGLDLVAEFRDLNKDMRIVMLTGYGNITTAVAAVKRGAVDYLAKPADADEINDALCAAPDGCAAPPENPMSADRVRWEHIQRVFELCERNVSETARRLSMHRRTLQRILAKRAPK
ncbi:MAG: ActR/PrrA/RegA family redox response regulator transcription factor [Alphaproteobacteria bacterium]|nr:ActR/PrrA/RegA family redox response regulator transcription factor [Alphaproteobacteria bacterium]MBE8220257.1 ActR/PrrA/RegA family redox response regulator transcription factor [Alphaproteobacteria bacterium]